MSSAASGVDNRMARMVKDSCNSFSEDTLVTTTDDEKVAISEIETEDTVLAYDPVTGEVDEYEVTHTWEHEDTTIVTLTIDGEVIETTPWHPFFTDEGWVDAGDLEVGDQILALDGEYGTVEVILIEERTETMYDLTVDEVHTFAVGAGEWVVHNVNCPRLLEIPEGELGTGRYRVETYSEIPNIPGIYEFIHLKRNSLPYVGSSLDLQDRISTHSYTGNFENYADVVFTPISGASKRNIELAETVRILQVRAEFDDDIYNMANGWNRYLEKITSKLYPVNENNVPKFWSSRDHLKAIQSLMNNSRYPWPSWLRP